MTILSNADEEVLVFAPQHAVSPLCLLKAFLCLINTQNSEIAEQRNYKILYSENIHFWNSEDLLSLFNSYMPSYQTAYFSRANINSYYKRYSTICYRLPIVKMTKRSAISKGTI